MWWESKVLSLKGFAHIFLSFPISRSPNSLIFFFSHIHLAQKWNSVNYSLSNCPEISISHPFNRSHRSMKIAYRTVQGLICISEFFLSDATKQLTTVREIFHGLWTTTKLVLYNKPNAWQFRSNSKAVTIFSSRTPYSLRYTTNFIFHFFLRFPLW